MFQKTPGKWLFISAGKCVPGSNGIYGFQPYKKPYKNF